jgi:predicted MPP superfamily phosphohydrolase
VFTNNSVLNNNGGIDLDSSSNYNSIYHNDFRDNGKSASDRSGTNIWDNGYPSGGNYWSDYKEKYLNAKEIDDTGIWNTPYEIPGDVGAKDSYPLVEPRREEIPKLSFTFVHLTDPHIGYYPWGDSDDMVESIEKFTDTLQSVKTHNPDFILNTGDIVEYDNPDFFKAYVEIIKSINIQIYHTSGNHDQRDCDFPYFSETSLDNYYEYIESENPTDNISLNDGYNGYYFDKFDYLFIGLDSGHDYDPWIAVDLSPEGSGLEDKQINSLNEPEIKDHPRKIIFMHHPVINDKKDLGGQPHQGAYCGRYGGNNQCIAVNRCEFIAYCLDNNVDLVLTGHTHKDYNKTIFNDAKTHKTEFIQTRSATKDEDDDDPDHDPDLHGYRVIKITDKGITNGSEVTPSDKDNSPPAYLKYVATLTIGECMGDPNCIKHLLSIWGISAYRDNQHTGMTARGDIERNIPNSYYTGYYGRILTEKEPQVLVVYGARPNRIIWHPVSQGKLSALSDPIQESSTYSPFNISIRSHTEDKVIEYRYDNVRLTDYSTAKVDLTSVKPDYTMEIDDDGDGTTDRKREPDSIETIRQTSIQLHTGWNLISLPLTPEDAAILNVLSPVADNWNSVWSYEGGNWKRYDLTGPDFLNSLTIMEPGKGYWLHMNSDDTLSITGSEPRVKSIPLSAGWNLVGYNSLNSMPTTEAMSSVEGNWNSVWSYEAGRWKRYDLTGPDFLNSLTIMEPGKGYWLNMKSPDTWTLGA